MDTDIESRISGTLHDLRTPLNQIIGFSEMLIEITREEGHPEVLEGIGDVREAGVELTHLLQDRRLIATEAQPGHEYQPLPAVVQGAAGRIIGFVESALARPPDSTFDVYRGDLDKIRSAARNFLEIAKTSNLLILRESFPHWGHSHAQVDPHGSCAAAPADKKGRVLIVDDESLNCEILCRRLQREGYDPVSAGSGREALALLHSGEFDAILLDILMPEMSGMEVLQALKQDSHLRHLPVIMLSALTDVERVVRCIELGAEDYLPKPINAVLLRARLGACLEKKRLRDQEQEHFQALHAEKQRLSVTLRSLTDAVVTTDADGRIVLMNDASAALTGMPGDAASGMHFEQVFRIYHRSNGLPASSIVNEVLAHDTAVETESGVAIMPPDGIERLVSVRSAPIHDHEGAIHGTVVVLRDITEKEKMASELLRTSKLQSLGVLAGGLAHDFNNMLTAVHGNLSLIQQQKDLPEDILPFLQETKLGAIRAQELTRHLLTFSEGGAPIKQVLQARKLIQETSAFVVRGSNVNCEFNLPADLWEAEADPNQLAQVISNIVLNAVEATPNGGKIFIAAENVTAPIRAASQLPEGDYLCVTVQDRGHGIAPEHLPRIYDPFFTTKKQARGLGLAAAYSIIQRHGGQISVESDLGSGTCVTFYLRALRRSTAAPAAAVPQGDQARRDDQAAGSNGAERKQRVLIMDDDDSIRLLAKIMFKRLNYEVVTTADGDAALAAHAEAAAAGQPFDLVVMDLTIPGGMGGKEAIRRLREKDTTVRAIVSSGYSNDPVMADYIQNGFNGVLPKPYVMDDLTGVLKQLKSA